MYTLLYPPKIVMGNNSINELPALLPVGAKTLIVAGRHFTKSDAMIELKAKMKDFEIVVFDNVSAEPPLEDVDQVVALGRNEQVAAVVAIGGGSVIDVAKAAAAIIPLEGMTKDYFFGEKSIEKKGLFFVALPTTAGTGAEITKNSVLTDKESKIKQSIRHPSMVADVAIIDPELTYSASPELTAASGLDAFTQAVESYATLNANAVTKALAASAVEKIYANLDAVYKNPSNVKGRELLAEGSLLSAMSFSQSGLGAVHGLAHPIGSLLGIPHGITCAVLLAPILKWNLSSAESLYAELAVVCGLEKDANLFFESVQQLCKSLNIPETFAEYGLKEEHFPFIIKNCRSNSMKGNPCYMTDDDVEMLLKGLV